MTKKISAAGLGYCHLDCVYKQDSPDGLVAILKDFNGKPEVTKDKKSTYFVDKQGQK